jgi:Cu(I)/Ag(I) efflux system membrane fusion protein
VLLAGGNSVVYAETKPGIFEIRPVTIGPILRDKIVVLTGLQEGEMVATAGNFLIDSQMQLAGKPSLIDPTRAIAKAGEQGKGPLKLASVDVMPVGGEAGQRLGELYAAYFQVQQALASDKRPPSAAAEALHQAAKSLSGQNVLPQSAAQLVREITVQSEHLHHMELAEARRQFKSISQAMVKLAAQVRSEGSENSFTHFYCPMVPSGGGDWLQSGGELLNPYFGSEMLRCGEKVQELPPKGKPKSEPHSHQDRRSAPPANGGA